MIDPPVATSLGLPEDYIKVLGTSRQSSARTTLPVCSNSYARISQSPSMGVLESTLNVRGESRAENIQFEETAVEGSKGEAASNYRDEDAMDEVTITESPQYRSLGVENPSADTGERDERLDDNDREGAASSFKQTHPNIPLKIPAGRFLSLCRHPQARPGRAKQFPSISEITLIRQPDSQATRTTKELTPRML